MDIKKITPKQIYPISTGEKMVVKGYSLTIQDIEARYFKRGAKKYELLRLLSQYPQYCSKIYEKYNNGGGKKFVRCMFKIEIIKVLESNGYKKYECWRD